MNTRYMKNLVLTIALLLAAAPAAMAQTVKLGHIDRQKLMLTLPERKDAETKMQAFAKTLDDRLKAMGAEYQQKVADAQAGAADMTQTQKDMVVEEIQELEQRFVPATIAPSQRIYAVSPSQVPPRQGLNELFYVQKNETL